MSERYAVYFSPDTDSELGQFGQTVFCRTANSIRTLDASSTFIDQDRWRQLTEKPAHYGFHATLKAPFELVEGQTLETLTSQVERFAASAQTIELATLYPRSLGGFMALNLDSDIDALSNFALNCVETFEPFRRALSDTDIARRKQHQLSDRQEFYLQKYGYPHVGDEFRFHLTLTGRLESDDQDFENWVISEYKNSVSQTPVLDRVSIFMQPDRATPFVQLSEHAFKA